ncbi:MAG: beta-glycosidase [Dysgonamonadaceae bacterium]|jgi:hypothetical protein|nr:beta-glycosidase [Dysgonamonadaceae bacterium]
MRTKIAILILTIVMFSACNKTMPEQQRSRIDLSGNWSYSFNSVAPSGDSLYLPGTTSTNRKGIRNEKKDETGFLSQEYYFEGKALYTKQIEIPETWQGKQIRLCMERTKPTTVWINDVKVGESNDISTPQWYDLTNYLTSGKYTLRIEVDNSSGVPEQVTHSSHAYVRDTQTNWNGIIGDFFLECSENCYIQEIQVYPDVNKKSATVKVIWKNSDPELKSGNLSFQAKTWNTSEKHLTKIEKQPVDLSAGSAVFELPLSDNMKLWSEFSPTLYKLSVSLETDKGTDYQSVNFGMRDFNVKGKYFTINDQVTFLRGKHDACVFPLTAHTAMDVETWQHYFQVAKSYGINHFRFHSWCPPKACFEAADIEGIYLQPELPIWGQLTRENEELNVFLQKEGSNIFQAYGNHASFVMFALGNELSGDQEVISDFVQYLREKENRLLFACGSNNFLGFAGPQPEEDYYTTCRVRHDDANPFASHVRGSFSFADAEDGGYINHTYPNSLMNFSSGVAQSDIPVISHETGQFQVYPDYNQIPKYTGVLKPWNLEIFRQRLKDAGMEEQAYDFFLASGKWAALLYRADIEMDLRTPDLAGFQLLDLQDYPGQGSAYVGMLDVFMDSKGLISPEEWRQFCCEVVPLFETEKFCWTNNEQLSGKVKLANYGATPFTKKSLNWSLKNGDKIINSGKFNLNSHQGELTEVGTITSGLASVDKATKATLELFIPGTPYRNNYDLWIYPKKVEIQPVKQFEIVHKMDAITLSKLENGTNILWFPAVEQYPDVTVGGLFQTDYWNYRMFKSICEWVKKPISPGTLGLLMNPQHPIFADFPTNFHTNWQWFLMVKASRPLILDRLPENYRPIVQVIDNIERNHKLGLIMEFAVGKGKLLICMSDLEKLEVYPEARQLYAGVINYMNSDLFQPAMQLTAKEVNELFSAGTKALSIKKLGNISY